MFTRIATAAAVLVGLTASASAIELQPGTASRIELGARAGIAYYTVSPAGYRVVTGIARKADSPSLRFETTLAAGQRVLVSAPQELGQPATSVEIFRDGDRVFIGAPATN
ncbi:hypothetical protein [Methylopila turkensis]|uniref:Uncharacterized protein n=1 Tax=Methylopila turkensis TaxID=1437816 RepID=A0A9W6N4X1_9HYPH|nr:hypothetical protein [Methylopila turkensis]GLK78579.1 hypothetical protein GCM10008174_03200 [Methylopila turkensis]